MKKQHPTNASAVVYTIIGVVSVAVLGAGYTDYGKLIFILSKFVSMFTLFFSTYKLGLFNDTLLKNRP